MRVGNPARRYPGGRDARAYQRRHTPGNRLRTNLLFRRGVDDLPVALHVDDRPLPGQCLVERLVEAPEVRLPVIGVFSLGVGMADQYQEARARAMLLSFRGSLTILDLGPIATGGLGGRLCLST
jgi:hypothetical protein